jgi:hypothetical protein
MYDTGVRSLVEFGHVPAIAQSDIIDGIRERLPKGAVIQGVQRYCGDVDRIQEGPLYGQN